jgi:hypothetical protein
MTPMLHMSTASPYPSFSLMISGATYPGEPHSPCRLRRNSEKVRALVYLLHKVPIQRTFEKVACARFRHCMQTRSRQF